MSYSQMIKVRIFNPQTYCRTIFDIVHIDFREKLSHGSQQPTHPLRDVYVGSSDLYVYFLNQRAGYNKLFGNRSRVSRLKIDFSIRLKK